jgi:electron transport complex protein RnfB
MSEDSVYRALQDHLDRQAVGFPPTPSGAELLFLEQLFTPEEARLALKLSYRPFSIEEILAATTGGQGWRRDQALALLESMASKGAIGWKQNEGVDCWFLMPAVVGMYEGQDGLPAVEFQRAADSYLGSREWGTAMLAASPPQMRTVPVGIDVPVHHHVASYDQIRAIMETAAEPFVVIPCICRSSAAAKGNPCRKTTRTETCLGFGESAAMIRKRKHGRRITREQAISILRENEKDGLVLQPSNAQDPAFVCSCCGCCCGMLGMQRRLPHPLEFWTTNFHAVVDPDLCTACGTCEDRCQVNAVAMKKAAGPRAAARASRRAVVDLNRCIGCGVCVPTCSAGAIRLEKNGAETVPPPNEEELYERIRAGRKDWAETRREVMRKIRGR